MFLHVNVMYVLIYFYKAKIILHTCCFRYNIRFPFRCYLGIARKI